MSEERYVTVAEVKELLEAEVEARGGYDFMLASQKAALDHAQKTCPISKEQAQAIIDDVMGLDFMDGMQAVAVKIADLLPEYPEDVRAIFSKERVTLVPDQIESILEIVRNHY